MYKNLIINYAKNMTINDITEFTKKNNITISEEDKMTIYNHIKKYYNVFFNNPISYIKKLKGTINDETYYNILILYDKYKDLL
ncbi:MAG: hypothetical protein IJL74_00755 [Bacilli bacterium]|nr:hypothetical protein [Bacilli bacterium]